jgi:hypothetical protein
MGNARLLSRLQRTNSSLLHPKPFDQDISRSLSSAVIFSASRKRPRLSALHLRDTASLLSPEWRHLSPCLGAALTASPLAGNLTRMGELVHPEATQYYKSSSPLSTELFKASRLASSLFFQLIRESPLHVTRTKSLPASYLTPSLMGTLLGLSISSVPPSEIRSVLRERHGIKSNYIDTTEWTGVSLTRWMDLIPTNACSLPIDSSTEFPLVSSVWLVALWEISDSKEDLLDFLIALEQILLSQNEPHRILDHSNPQVEAIIHDPIARKEWASQEFDPVLDLSPDAIGASFDRLQQWTGDKSWDNPTFYSEWTNAMEIVCAAASLNHLPLLGKPACPTGYYGFDGGGIQADCAELTAREIINLLLWDEHRGCFDLGRLPSTASPKLAELYDESIHPFDQSGDAWFQILSELSGCDYLATSPNGRPYELAPTVANILRALQVLLFGDGSRITEPKWTTFQDLADTWKSGDLQVYESTLTHQSSTTGELLHHEFATLRLENSTSGIELRLRYNKADNSGMSKVTHLQERHVLIDDEQFNTLLAPVNPISNKVIGLALGGDILLEQGAESNVTNPVQELAHILGTPFGCDRRGLLTSDLGEPAQLGAMKESESILKSSIQEICQWSHSDELLGATLLPWLLSERPTVFEGKLPTDRVSDPRIEDSMLGLPHSILGNNTVYEALEHNWAVHGRPLAAWARWNSGCSSIAAEMSQLPTTDLARFVALMLTKK